MTISTASRIIPIPGGFLSAQGPFGGSAGAALPWYLSGGIAAANCLVAYTPKGAASLAASYDNNAAPGNGLADGTYDAALGVAPTFNGATGWGGNGSTVYLTTGITPPSACTVLVRFSDLTMTTGMILGEWDAAYTSIIWLWPNTGGSVHEYGRGSTGRDIAGAKAAGVMGLVGDQGYFDGLAEGASIPAGGEPDRQLYIFAANGGYGAATYFADGNIQAVAIYKVILTGLQAPLVMAAMAAL